jgi:hypothetical protein
MRSLTLVACVAKKLPHAAPARDLYCSPWFRLARAVAEASGEWRILSAEHGLLDPAQVVAPYEKSLRGMTAAERKEWGRQTLVALFRLLDPPREDATAHGFNVYGRRVVFLAGEIYAGPLADALGYQGASVETPLAHLGIGQQLRWLKTRLAELQGKGRAHV